MIPRIPRRLLSLCIFLPFAAPVHAATISWGAITGIAGDTDVSTAGTFVRAVNFGVDPAVTATTTINTVVFTNESSAYVDAAVTTPTTATYTSTGVHTVTPTGDSDVVGFAKGRSASGEPYNSLSAEYRSLLSTIVYTGGAAGGDAGDRNAYTFTLAGLTEGTTYAVQLWFNDSRSSNRVGTLSDAGVVDYNRSAGNTAGGVGSHVIGTFTADGTTQTFDFTAGVSNSVAAQLNAYQLRIIPEPSATLAAIAGFAIAGMRRRRS